MTKCARLLQVLGSGGWDEVGGSGEIRYKGEVRWNCTGGGDTIGGGGTNGHWKVRVDCNKKYHDIYELSLVYLM